MTSFHECLKKLFLVKSLKATNEQQNDGAGILHQWAQIPIDQVYLYTRCPCPSLPTQDPERQGFLIVNMADSSVKWHARCKTWTCALQFPLGVSSIILSG